ELLARSDLQLDLRIGLAEGRDQRLEQNRYCRTRHRDTQQSGWPLPEVTRDGACGHELFESGLGTREESLAGFGQPDTARGAREEGCARPRLEGASRLADRRWRDAELCRRSAKVAVLGNFQKRLDAIERALSHCEVLLHGPCTLS